MKITVKQTYMKPLLILTSCQRGDTPADDNYRISLFSHPHYRAELSQRLFSVRCMRNIQSH